MRLLKLMSVLGVTGLLLVSVATDTSAHESPPFGRWWEAMGSLGPGEWDCWAPSLDHPLHYPGSAWNEWLGHVVWAQVFPSRTLQPILTIDLRWHDPFGQGYYTELRRTISPFPGLSVFLTRSIRSSDFLNLPPPHDLYAMFSGYIVVCVGATQFSWGSYVLRFRFGH